MNHPTATLPREATSFRFKPDLLKKLRASAKAANRSLNNYVESILLAHEYHVPNAETIEAIEELKRGEYAGEIDFTDSETFWKSILE